MNIIIAGSRDFRNSHLMLTTLRDLINQGVLPSDLTLVCGMARGADMTAHQIFTNAKQPIIEMPAQWDKYGKSAGYRRNVDMSKIADIALCFWNGVSPGTKHMIDIMKSTGKPVIVFNY